MIFSKWIDTFVSEKGIDREDIITVEGESGENIIPVGVLVDMMKSAPTNEQNGIKTMLVKIDFVAPGQKPVMDYFTHLAKAVAL